jgi:hypothetical protein
VVADGRTSYPIGGGGIIRVCIGWEGGGKYPPSVSSISIYGAKMLLVTGAEIEVVGVRVVVGRIGDSKVGWVYWWEFPDGMEWLVLRLEVKLPFLLKFDEAEVLLLPVGGEGGRVVTVDLRELVLLPQ